MMNLDERPPRGVDLGADFVDHQAAGPEPVLTSAGLPSGKPRLPPGARMAAFSAVFTTAAAFGPYTASLFGDSIAIPGIRTEQLAVYGSLMIALPFTLARLRPSRHAIGVIVALSVTVFVATVGALWPPFNNSVFDFNSVPAGLDNVALPLATVVLVQVWLISGQARLILRCVLVTAVILMWVNAVLAVVSIAVDLTPVLSVFWTSAQADNTTVAVRSAQLGRLSGIVNQPAEAGALYGIAILASVYLWKDRILLLAGSMVVLVIGGALTVSKIFVFVALPLAAWQMLRIARGRAKRLAGIGVAAVTALVAVQSGLFPEWQGRAYLERLADPTGGAVTFYTAGRLGTGSSLAPVFHAALGISPWFGAGAAGLAAPYDNAWLEALVMAGVVGALSYTALLVIMAHAWWSRRGMAEPNMSRLVGAVVVLVAAGSVGLPILTANRAGTVLWLVIGLAVLADPVRAHTGWASGELPASDPLPEDGEPTGPLEPTGRLVRAAAST